MLYELIGIESTSTTLTWIFIGLSLMFAVPAVAIVMVTRYVARAAAARKASATPATVFRFDVFLSYSSADQAQAAALAAQLEHAGVRLFFAERTLEAGSAFTEEIRKALHDSRETWLLASPASLASTWVATEWGTAWALDRKIVPVLLNLTAQELPDRLRMVHTVAYGAVAAEVARARARFAPIANNA